MASSRRFPAPETSIAMKITRLLKLILTYGLPAALVIYFGFHSYVVHYGSIPVRKLFVLTAVFMAVAILLQFIFTRFFAKSDRINSKPRAAVFTFLLLLLVLFFGVFQDMITSWQPIATVGRLIWLFPITICLLILSFLAIMRSASSFLRFRKFLSALLICYFVLDVIELLTVTERAQNTTRSASNTTNGKMALNGKSKPVEGQDGRYSQRPPVYLIILDEYLGNESLLAYYNYPNHSFQSYLTDNGFHIVKKPNSNYNWTIFSMSSMFNMDYLRDIGKPVFTNHYAYKKALRLIEHNRTCSLFVNLGYTVKNKSFFYFNGEIPAYSNGLLPDKMDLVQHQTMYYRVVSALPDLLADQANWKYFANRKVALAERNNMKMIEDVLREAPVDMSTPTFTYLHLLMPHNPILRDSMGKRLRTPTGELINDPPEKPEEAYLGYLVYTNKVISNFITNLKRLTQNKAVILLMSDHGSKSLGRENDAYSFNNLHAVYLPDGDYKEWYDGVTNVNAFPLLFRTLYGLDIPLRKDSITVPTAP
jgi:hypothetical protein